jgi:class 3 adenylate cyclase
MEHTVPLPAGTVTFLFTDIEASTRLWDQHPEAMRVALARHDAILRRAIENHGGHVFKTVGDAFCTAFATGQDALYAVLAAQISLRAEAWGEVGALPVRMALHTGAAEERGGDYFGPPLNRVARLLALAHGGQVLLSRATQSLVQDELPDSVSLKDLGLHRLKDLQRLENVFQLSHSDLPSDFPPLQQAPAIPGDLPREELLKLLLQLQRQLEVQNQHHAFLSVDVVGSSEMKRSASEFAVELSFGQYRRWVEEVVRANDGEMQSTAGDGMMGIFPTDTGAVRAARQLQDRLQHFNAEQNRLPMPFRIRCGVSAGEVAIQEGIPLGHLQSVVIDRAAVLQKRAEPGDILVSGEAGAAALLELGGVSPLSEPIAGEPAFSWRAGVRKET